MVERMHGISNEWRFEGWTYTMFLVVLQASQQGLVAFIRPVQTNMLGDSPCTAATVGLGEVCKGAGVDSSVGDAVSSMRELRLAARKSVANVLEQLDDIMQVIQRRNPGKKGPGKKAPKKIPRQDKAIA